MNNINVSNFITQRLEQSNYPIWREQALALTESQDLSDHIFGISPPPVLQNLETEEAVNEAPLKDNPEFIKWKKHDRILRGWLISTMSPEAVSIILGIETTKGVWDALANAYAQNSQERAYALRQQLMTLRKDSSTPISEHVRIFKGISDSLAAIGHSVPDGDKVFLLCTSLGPTYLDFTTTMLKAPRPNFAELLNNLRNHEMLTDLFSGGSNSAKEENTQYAFVGQRRNRSNEFSSAGRGFSAQLGPMNSNSQTPAHMEIHHHQAMGQRYNASGNYSSPYPQSRYNYEIGLQHNQQAGHQQNKQYGWPEQDGKMRRPPPPGCKRMTPEERRMYESEICQHCHNKGHIAKICWWYLLDKEKKKELPQALAALTLDTSVIDTEWTTDTGASQHMTGNKG